MGIRLLGPVELRTEDGGRAEVAGAKRRAVLALLALEFGQTVPVERFFELLWGEEPPVQARAALQGHVAALRKVLSGTPFALVTEPPGYRLDGDPRYVDAHRFDSLAAGAAAAPDDASAAALLESALNLWSGPALAGLPDTPLGATLVERLDDARVAVLEAWAERLLRIGSGQAGIPALEQAVRADGLRESTVALLIRCLHQAGQAADALTVYQHTRDRLADELGVTPGSTLGAAFRTLSATPGGAVEPEQQARTALGTPGSGLPRRPRGFVGRAVEADWLDRECGAGRTGGGLAVVVGAAGTGKTATVVQWAHSVRPRFPDGLLFADLRGFDPADPADPSQALGCFLRALGVAEDAVPEEQAAREALYRERTRDRRLLVVLDNIRTAADVSALLPAGPACSTVVTSRSTLEDLVVTAGAAVLRLEALPEADALGLLERLLTAARVRAEPGAAARLVALCDRLPLALRIAAARLASRPGWSIADLVDELTDERLRLLALDTHGTSSVTSALSLTFRHLGPDAAQLLGLLTAHPGAGVDVHAAAALLGSGAGPARHALGELAAHHLLSEDAPGRYGRHDLVRLFGQRVQAEQGGGHEPLVRLLDYYLAVARRAAELLQPGVTDGAPPVVRAPAALPRLPDVRAALAWFAVEEPTIRSLVASAAEGGEPDRAWRLADVGSWLYRGAGRQADRLSCLRSGLRAARDSGSGTGLALLRIRLAGAVTEAGRPDEALELAAEAIAATGPADGALHVSALTAKARALAAVGDLDQAVRLVDRAVELCTERGLGVASAGVLTNAAGIHGMAGEREVALALARRARGLLAEHPLTVHHIIAMANEAQALHSLGELGAAEVVWRGALEHCRDSGLRQLQALTEHQVAEFLAAIGRRADAAVHLRSAVDLHTRHGDAAVAERLRARLSELESPAADGPAVTPARPAPAAPAPGGGPGPRRSSGT